MSFPKAYNSKDNILVIGGAQVTGFGEGDIVLSRNEDLVIPKVGHQGDIVINYNNNDTGTLTVPLQPEGSWAQILRNYTTIAKATNNPFLPIGFYVPAQNLTVLTTGWIQTMPDAAAGQQGADQEFIIGLADANGSLIESVTDVASLIAAVIA